MIKLTTWKKYFLYKTCLNFQSNLCERPCMHKSANFAATTASKLNLCLTDWNVPVSFQCVTSSIVHSLSFCSSSSFVLSNNSSSKCWCSDLELRVHQGQRWHYSNLVHKECRARWQGRCNNSSSPASALMTSMWIIWTTMVPSRFWLLISKYHEILQLISPLPVVCRNCDRGIWLVEIIDHDTDYAVSSIMLHPNFSEETTFSRSKSRLIQVIGWSRWYFVQVRLLNQTSGQMYWVTPGLILSSNVIHWPAHSKRQASLWKQCTSWWWPPDEHL